MQRPEEPTKTVLGGMFPLGVKNGNEIDSIFQGCFSIHNAKIFSQNYEDYGIVMAFLANKSKGYAAQIFFSFDLQHPMYRIRWNDTTQWGQWASL